MTRYQLIIEYKRRDHQWPSLLTKHIHHEKYEKKITTGDPLHPNNNNPKQLRCVKRIF